MRLLILSEDTTDRQKEKGKTEQRKEMESALKELQDGVQELYQKKGNKPEDQKDVRKEDQNEMEAALNELQEGVQELGTKG